MSSGPEQGSGQQPAASSAVLWADFLALPLSIESILVTKTQGQREGGGQSQKGRPPGPE